MAGYNGTRGGRYIDDPRPVRAVAVGRVQNGAGNEWTSYSSVFEDTNLEASARAKIEEFYYELEFVEKWQGFFWYPIETGRYSCRFFWHPETLRARAPDQDEWERFGEVAKLCGLYWHRRSYGLVSDHAAINGTGKWQSLKWLKERGGL